MAFWGIAYCPRGRNRAPFRSTIDGFRDIGNRSFGRVIIGDFHDERLKMALEQLHIALWVEIELRFAVRSTVSEIMANEVLAKWPLSKTLKYATLERFKRIHTPQLLTDGRRRTTAHTNRLSAYQPVT